MQVCKLSRFLPYLSHLDSESLVVFVSAGRSSSFKVEQEVPA
jgi:hypothetical protein